MRLLLTISQIIGLVVGIGLCLLPLIYWWMNPELSQMQVLQKMWPAMLVGVCFVVAARVSDMLVKDKKNDDEA